MDPCEQFGGPYDINQYHSNPGYNPGWMTGLGDPHYPVWLRGNNDEGSSASFSHHNLKQINDEVYEVHSPPVPDLEIVDDKGSSASFSHQNLKQINAEVYEVYCPPVPDLEIVFFHGMQEDFQDDAYFTTWMSENNSQLWPQTWLVEAFPTARILTVSYDSSSRRQADVYHLGENLVHSLTDGQVGQAGCPVVLVGYCVGGLVIKQVCLTATSLLAQRGENWRGVKRTKDFVSNLRGMFYFGTSHFAAPHHGSFLGEDPVRFCARLNEQFCDLRANYGWEDAAIGETRETFVKHLQRSALVVHEGASRYGVATFYTADADHLTISRPGSKFTIQFRGFEDFLSKILDRSRAARQVSPIVRKDDGPVQWYDDPIRYTKMCDPVKCSDGLTYDRWTIIKYGLTRCPQDSNKPLSIVADDISIRAALFEEFPERLLKFKKRRGRYKKEALQHASANPIEFMDAIEKLNNVLKWLPLDTECQDKLAEIQDRWSQGSTVTELPTYEIPTEARSYEIPAMSQEDVIRARGRDFETRWSTFVVFIFIAVCFFMSLYSASIEAGPGSVNRVTNQSHDEL